MTDSANNNPKNNLNDFNDELDAMLDKVKSSLDSSYDREDDEDALDRLLLAEEFDAEEPYQADGSRDHEIDDIDLSDGFDDDFEEMRFDGAREEEFDPFVDVVSDDETSSSDDQMPSGTEGFFEINDFDEQESEASNLQKVDSVDQNSQTEALFEDYQDNNFFADFNVLPDWDILDDMGLKNQPDIDEARPAQDTAIPEEKPETVLSSISMPALDEFMARIRPRRSEEDRLEFDNADMAASNRSNPDQESISPLPKALSAEFENKTKNTRFFVYIAIGLGSAALIAAIGFGLMAYSAKKEASRLSERVNTLEVAAAGNSSVQSSDTELDDIKAAIEQLNQRVDGIMEQLSNKAPLSAEAEINEPIEGVAGIEAELDRLKDLQTRLNVLESKALTEDAAKSAATKQAAAYAKMKESKPQGVSGKTNTTADWFVNLIAYRQQWYAKSKAAEFEQKGIPVEVVDVKVNNVIWYRLRVGGFKNRSEAASYATKVKKALKLTSVWVGNIQG